MTQAKSRLHETITSLEHQMWDAFSNGNSAEMARLIAPHAMMLVGGGRFTGARYIQETGNVKLEHYTICDEEVIELFPGAAAIHYTVDVNGAPGSEDLSGIYRVSSVWLNTGLRWELILNHDQQLVPPRP